MRRVLLGILALALVAVTFVTSEEQASEANHCDPRGIIKCHATLYPNPNFYFAEQFYDGAIHCAVAEGWLTSYAGASLGNPGGYSPAFYGEFTGSTRQGPFCSFWEDAGKGWISVNVTLWRWNDGWIYPQFCTSTGWQSNQFDGISPTMTVSLGSKWYDPRLQQWRTTPYSVAGTSCAGWGGRFQVQAEFYIARNLGMRYASLWTSPEVRGG
jgi:hypothetical protein